MKQRALFPGSFNPFTVGHADLVERALTVFDEVIIAVSINPDKTDIVDTVKVLELTSLYKDNPRVIVVSNTGLTYECAKEYNCTAIMRGSRNATDMQEEIVMSEINRKYGNIETIIFPSRPEYSHISSSLVRTLQKLNLPTDDYIFN